MEENEILNMEKGGRFYKILITEAITAVIILLSVLTVKYFFRGCYSSLSNWYGENICTETDVNEVLAGTGGETDEV